MFLCVMFIMHALVTLTLYDWCSTFTKPLLCSGANLLVFIRCQLQSCMPDLSARAHCTLFGVLPNRIPCLLCSGRGWLGVSVLRQGLGLTP
uniref:Putative secreted protein n=1 Tax=Amblyomma triste TaxID=251400 RepID=A0A023G3T4_AMBTT